MTSAAEAGSQDPTSDKPSAPRACNAETRGPYLVSNIQPLSSTSLELLLMDGSSTNCLRDLQFRIALHVVGLCPKQPVLFKSIVFALHQVLRSEPAWVEQMRTLVGMPR
mmetsp:Transcript_23130/g.92483  ORF Transcript_23130/g.92483 Transcript_23130/m.92483 type:complete len:109 (-) Transcript_23130:1047-1373(-)